MWWDGGGGGLRRVLPERRMVGVACTALGAVGGAPAILLAGDRLWGLAWFALFAVVTALLTTFADLVPVQDGADAAQPAPRRPDTTGGARTHLAAGARGMVAVLFMAGFAASHAGGGSAVARLAGVLL